MNSQKLKVLIVEDSEPDIALIEYHVESNNLEADLTFARTVEEADACLTERFDMIFLDANLTGKSNGEAETMPLLRKIAGDYPNRIYATTDNDLYARQMKEQFDVPHVKKELIHEQIKMAL